MRDFFRPLVLLASFCALRDSISVRAAVKLCALPFKLLETFFAIVLLHTFHVEYMRFRER